jgi:hypothetical protein
MAAHVGYVDAHDVKLLKHLLWISNFKPFLTGADPTVDGGLSLSLGLAVRSECLLQLEENESCLADIQLAIREGFPEHRRCLTACPFTSGRHMQGWANHYPQAYFYEYSLIQPTKCTIINNFSTIPYTCFGLNLAIIRGNFAKYTSLFPVYLALLFNYFVSVKLEVT